MRNDKKILFNPDQNAENKYIDQLIGPLVEKGYNISSLDQLFMSWKHFWSIRLAHLNWFENLHADKLYKSLFRKLLVLSLLKLTGKKLVWTMHNRQSHEGETGKWSVRLSNLLLSWSDAIVIHSKSSKDILSGKNKALVSKTYYVPHPNFVNAYGEVVSSEHRSAAPLKLLFIGAVKPYKNIELLIRVCAGIGPSVSLSICGSASSAAYAGKLQKLAAMQRNVELNLRFIPDGEIPALIGDADVLVFPYDIKSSLNSGSVYLAFSYQRTVICPAIGSISDLSKEAQEKVFAYTYTDEFSHARKLRQRIETAVTLKQRNPLYLEEMGLFLYAEMLEKHDPYQSASALDRLYDRLLS